MTPLEDGRACYERRAWGDAYDAMLAADQETPLEPEDLDRLATAAYLSGHDAEFGGTFRFSGTGSVDGLEAVRGRFYLATENAQA